MVASPPNAAAASGGTAATRFDVNLRMVQLGGAWVYESFASRGLSPAAYEGYKAALAEAKRARRGLWADPAPQNPREWRIAHPREE
jgi:micrococcal nuclease